MQLLVKWNFTQLIFKIIQTTGDGKRTISHTGKKNIFCRKWCLIALDCTSTVRIPHKDRGAYIGIPKALNLFQFLFISTSPVFQDYQKNPFSSLIYFINF